MVVFDLTLNVLCVASCWRSNVSCNCRRRRRRVERLASVRLQPPSPPPMLLLLLPPRPAWPLPFPLAESLEDVQAPRQNPANSLGFFTILVNVPTSWSKDSCSQSPPPTHGLFFHLSPPHTLITYYASH